MNSTAQYVRFLGKLGGDLSPADARTFQNFFIGEGRTWEGATYVFAPFAIAGSSSSLGGSNGQAELTMPANLLSGAALFEAAQRQFLIEVKTVLLLATPGDPVTWTEHSTLSRDVWVAEQFVHSDSVPGEEEEFGVVVLSLTSPLNAVEGTAPNVRLKDEQVGSLPVTGRIVL